MYIHIEIHEHNTSVLIQNLRHAHAGTPSLSFKHINKHFTSHLAHYCILLFLPCNRQFVAKSLLHLWQHEVRLLSLVFGALVARQNVAQSDLMFCQDKMTFPLDILFILFFFSFLSFSLLFSPLFLNIAHSTRCFSPHASLSHTPTLSLPVLFLFLFLVSPVFFKSSPASSVFYLQFVTKQQGPSITWRVSVAVQQGGVSSVLLGMAGCRKGSSQARGNRRFGLEIDAMESRKQRN